MISKIKRLAYAIALFLIIVSCTRSPLQNPPLEFTAAAEATDTLIPTLTVTPKATSTPEIKTSILEESTSPDRNWTAVISLTIQGKNKRLDFRVSGNSTNQEWLVDREEWDESQTSVSYILFPYVFQWSADNASLYYSYEPNFNDGCFGYFKPGGRDFKRLDLSTGKSVTLREGPATWMALSPDEKKLAYVDSFGGNVSILDLMNGKEQTFPLPPIKNDLGMETDTKKVFWAPDGKTLIYAHLLGVCDYKIWYSYIIQINPSTERQRILVDHNEQGYIPVEWNIQDKVLLTDNEDNHWWLNPSTKEITPTDQ